MGRIFSKHARRQAVSLFSLPVDLLREIALVWLGDMKSIVLLDTACTNHEHRIVLMSILNDAVLDVPTDIVPHSLGWWTWMARRGGKVMNAFIDAMVSRRCFHEHGFGCLSHVKVVNLLLSNDADLYAVAVSLRACVTPLKRLGILFHRNMASTLLDFVDCLKDINTHELSIWDMNTDRTVPARGAPRNILARRLLAQWTTRSAATPLLSLDLTYFPGLSASILEMVSALGGRSLQALALTCAHLLCSGQDVAAALRSCPSLTSLKINYDCHDAIVTTEWIVSILPCTPHLRELRLEQCPVVSAAGVLVAALRLCPDICVVSVDRDHTEDLFYSAADRQFTLLPRLDERPLLTSLQLPVAATSLRVLPLSEATPDLIELMLEKFGGHATSFDCSSAMLGLASLDCLHRACPVMTSLRVTNNPALRDDALFLRAIEGFQQPLTSLTLERMEGTTLWAVIKVCPTLREFTASACQVDVAVLRVLLRQCLSLEQLTLVHCGLSIPQLAEEIAHCERCRRPFVIRLPSLGEVKVRDALPWRARWIRWDAFLRARLDKSWSGRRPSGHPWLVGLQ